MTRATLALACLVLALAACAREEAQPVAEPTPAADAAPIASPPPAVATPAETPTAAFDVRDYAGTFVAGADRLELGPDGVYRLDEGGAIRDGTWTVEQDDTRIRLDPNSKSEPDRVFAMDGRDRLTLLDDAGQPAADAPAWTREAVAR